MTKKLQVTLYVTAGYLSLFGIVFAFAPGVFERITQSALPDAALTLLYGQYLLTFAYVAFMAARVSDASSALVHTIFILTVGHVAVFAYLLAARAQGLPQAGPPLVVNSVLSVLLFVFRRNRNHE